MASGPAIEKRWGKKPSELDADHIGWDIEAHYLSVAIMDAILMISPEKIILGGGVMKQSHLFPLIRKKSSGKIKRIIIKVPEILENIENYIVYPELGDNAGICGGLALALRELKK